MKKIVVIGGGLSGLAAAALLAKHGYTVDLFEKNTSLGGRARTYSEDGFSFDMGPSWYMMPEIFDDYFGLFGKKTSDFYTLKRLDPRYRIYFDDGQSVTLADSINKNAELFESLEAGAGKKLIAYLDHARRAYEATTDKLLQLDIWNIGNLARRDVLQSLRTLISNVRIFGSWHDFSASYFTNEKIQKILGFPAVFLGGSPFSTPAIFSILNWADFGKGIWYPLGGMKKVVEALEKLARENGVRIQLNSEVKHILVDGLRVNGVMSKNTFYEADYVIAATDIPWVESNLLPTHLRTKSSFWAKKKIGISGLLLYLGLNKKLQKSIHHSLYFSKNWKENFDAIDQGAVPIDPSFYLSIRSASDATVAPQGSEELFVLIPLGAKGTYSTHKLEKLADKTIEKIEMLLGEPVREHIMVKKLYSPDDFENDYHAFGGTALGLAHTWNQSLWLRSKNKHSKIKGLLYAGQYTNPGVGVPMALLSAQQAFMHIAKYDGNSKNQIFKKGSTTYYYSSLFFQGQIKKDVFDLYAYVRVIDDLVDSSQPDLEQIDYYWRETKKSWEGLNVTNAVIQDFVDLAKRKKFQWEWVESFWKAMKNDLTKKIYHTDDELFDYIFGSAEVVGFMMAKILDLPEKAMRAAAMQGRAMQYINFVRDVHEDAQMGRNYLGYSTNQVKDQKQWEKYIRSKIDHYFEMQAEAEKGYSYIPKKYLIPIKTAADMYSWTARKIYNNPNMVWSEKVKPSKYQVFGALIRNLITL